MDKYVKIALRINVDLHNGKFFYLNFDREASLTQSYFLLLFLTARLR